MTKQVLIALFFFIILGMITALTLMMVPHIPVHCLIETLFTRFKLFEFTIYAVVMADAIAILLLWHEFKRIWNYDDC